MTVAVDIPRRRIYIKGNVADRLMVDLDAPFVRRWDNALVIVNSDND